MVWGWLRGLSGMFWGCIGGVFEGIQVVYWNVLECIGSMLVMY